MDIETEGSAVAEVVPLKIADDELVPTIFVSQIGTKEENEKENDYMVQIKIVLVIYTEKKIGNYNLL